MLLTWLCIVKLNWLRQVGPPLTAMHLTAEIFQLGKQGIQLCVDTLTSDLGIVAGNARTLPITVMFFLEKAYENDGTAVSLTPGYSIDPSLFKNVY